MAQAERAVVYLRPKERPMAHWVRRLVFPNGAPMAQRRRGRASKSWSTLSVRYRSGPGEPNYDLPSIVASQRTDPSAGIPPVTPRQESSALRPQMIEVDRT